MNHLIFNANMNGSQFPVRFSSFSPVLA